MKIIKIAAVVPTEYRPTNDTPFIYQRRLTDTETVSRTTGRRAHKEYIVRVYRYDNDMWSIIAFYGRIGGSLTMDWKGASSNPASAREIAIRVINEKISDSSKHYRRDDENVRTDIPGRDDRDQTSPINQAGQPSQTPSGSSLSSVPSFSTNVMAHITSIRLPSEYIPNSNTAYIKSTRMVLARSEWVIRVYVVIGGDHSRRYITAEWYSPDGREFRIHPKYFGPDMNYALAMAERLVEQKRRCHYVQTDDNRMAPGTPARKDLLEMPLSDKTTVVPPEDAPVKEEELTPEAKEILELLGSNKNIIKMAQNIEMPDNSRMPTSNTEYIRSERLIKTTEGSNKEYVIRVYRYNDGMYSVICFNGRIAGTLTAQPKYLGRSVDAAISVAMDWFARKRNSGYVQTDDNRWAPGRPFPGLAAQLAQTSTTSTATLMPTSEPSTSESLPTIEHFANELRGVGTARMGDYAYMVGAYGSSASRHMGDYYVTEYTEDYRSPTRQESCVNIDVARRLAIQWATERRSEQLNKKSPKVTPEIAPKKTVPEDAPVKEEELTPEAKEILELLGSNNNITKTAQTSPVMTFEMAKNPLTPTKELEKVIESLRDDFIAQTVAQNPSLSNEFLSGYIDTLISSGTKAFVNSAVLCTIVRERKLMSNVLSKVLMSDIDDLVVSASLNPNCWRDDLAKTYKKYSDSRHAHLSRKNIAILSNIAANPSTPSDLLSKIINNPKEEMRIKQVACANTNMPREVLSKIIMDGLSKGVGEHNEGIFYRSLANPNAPPALLLRISRSDSSSSFQKQVVDSNPNNPAMSSVGISDYIRGWIDGKTSDTYAVAAVSNPSALPKDLVAVLDQGINNIVSMAAAKNNNIPFNNKYQWVTRVLDENEMYANFPDIYIQWLTDRILEAGRIQDISDAFVDRVIDVLKKMSASNITSRLQSYIEKLVIKCMDSSVLQEKVFEIPHDILGKLRLPSKNRRMIDEKINAISNEPQEGKDDLMELLGENKNWYKTAQEDWYTKEIARTTTDPEILTRILRREKDDWVSYRASGNPHCSPEVLAEVLRRGKDDSVSCNAAYNSNCPPEVLAEVLRRGKDGVVSCNAARNSHCPPEVLTEVLRRGKDNIVSAHAAYNPNCPPDDAIKWLRLFKKEIPEDVIKRQKEIENKHQEELEKKRQEEIEWKELEKDPKAKEILELLGKNKNNIKRQGFTNDWYCDLSESVANDVRGYFKFIVRSNNAPIDIYNIWWKGCGSKVSISQHDLPKEEFETYKDQIMQKAVVESLKSYKEVMLSYGE